MRLLLCFLLLGLIGCAHNVVEDEEKPINVNDLPLENCDSYKEQVTQANLDYELLKCATELAEKSCNMHDPYYNMKCSEMLGEFCANRTIMFAYDRAYKYADCIKQQTGKKIIVK